MAEFERLGEASVQAFETEGLIGTSAAPAVLAYLFHRSETISMVGPPFLLSMKVGLPSTTTISPASFASWLKTLRKKNASVIFATQSLSDIDGSAIAPAIIESLSNAPVVAERNGRSSRRYQLSTAASP